MNDNYWKLPRLYTNQTLELNATLSLDGNQAHYLKNVLRQTPENEIRIFNGRDGEFLYKIKGLAKNSCLILPIKQIKQQPQTYSKIELLFAPLKKDRMDFVIEKSVELGVTDFHPILTNRTEVRKINEDRINAQIQEAAEQCERLILPKLHPLKPFKEKATRWSEPGHNPLLWCYERAKGSPHLSTFKNENWAFLVGPVGGFDESEIEFLSRQSYIQPISLGPDVLRAETASILCLTHAKLVIEK